MTPACATGMEAAKIPARNLAKIIREMVEELAMTQDESAAPARQMLSVLRRPTLGRDDRPTMRGHMTICAMEKALVERPTCTGVAPMD